MLDFGSGDGFLSYLLGARLPNATIVGIEYEESGIALARAKIAEKRIPNVSFVLNQDSRLPFPNEHFDAIVMADVIEHLPNVGEVLQELERVLRKDGRIVVTTPQRQEGSKWDKRHIFEFDTADLSREMQKFFTNVRVFGCSRMNIVRAWQKKRLMRAVLEVVTRSGLNVFTNEVENPDRSYGQLTAIGEKTGS
ncbi:hypothetical protein UNPF46_23930 [Bradyrhizobium sp. UNPF46]|nr:hypothetical protein UNPF46_23930 [Bradyrhizobium sp. UNPF46]